MALFLSFSCFWCPLPVFASFLALSSGGTFATLLPVSSFCGGSFAVRSDTRERTHACNIIAELCRQGSLAHKRPSMARRALRAHAHCVRCLALLPLALFYNKKKREECAVVRLHAQRFRGRCLQAVAVLCCCVAKAGCLSRSKPLGVAKLHQTHRVRAQRRFQALDACSRLCVLSALKLATVCVAPFGKKGFGLLKLEIFEVHDYSGEA